MRYNQHRLSELFDWKDIFKIPILLFVAYMTLAGFFGEQKKEIVLLDKHVELIHKDDISYCLYKMSFYYTDKPDMIYHDKKQPLGIWRQVYNKKDNTKIELNFGHQYIMGGVAGILLLLLLFFVFYVEFE